MLAAQLGTFLVLYVALFALIGFVAFVLRGTLRPGVANLALLRVTSGLAFVVAFFVWLFVLPPP